jgi:hypothetical protein
MTAFDYCDNPNITEWTIASESVHVKRDRMTLRITEYVRTRANKLSAREQKSCRITNHGTGKVSPKSH